MPSKKKDQLSELMVVNDAPGEECRIAILQDKHLEELYSERSATATNVGNIYKGRVVNVESAIQAAFVDFGEGQNGFLHISDLHPRYFPGKERTERVGKKIPRRERPLIQEALKRGDEVLVQVLKEGLGTKGPTLTSYLSIPGRMLVAMPDMDRVGVSRRVEDEQKRREMRQTLDALDLPEGFGFILRTAGFGQPKAELKRDVAYLTRLWKVMKARIDSVGAPCELYTESDLLIRTIRDVLRPSIEAIIVDSESAYERTTAFLKVVAPRTAPRVIRYRPKTPIFHAFGVERQIDLIHSREVPLPSGGKLVIEQTEALVAIDVNSGRSRSARDSETNAYRTNCEAVDEISRQLRLRDLGGLIVNDLIDMHMLKHRRDIEDRLRQHLKLDRAKTTITRISQFGILEMTRQRMRPSMRKSHFMPCPHCDGHGEIKSPESVGADAVRQIGCLLQYERVKRVEIACAPRVASVLLSGKRRDLVRLEDDFEKRIDVRVSDAIADDRVDYYAYDDRNADIDTAKLPALATPTIKELLKEEHAHESVLETTDGEKPKRRRRRRKKKPGPADATTIALEAPVAGASVDEDDEAAPAKKKRSRRRRRRRGKEAVEMPETVAEEVAPPIRIHVLAKEIGVASREIVAFCQSRNGMEVKNHMSAVCAADAGIVRDWFARAAAEVAESEAATAREAGDDGKKKRSRRRRRGAKKADAAAESDAPTNMDEEAAEEAPKKKRRTRRRKKAAAAPAEAEGQVKVEAPEASETEKPKKRRRRGRRKASAEAAEEATPEQNEQASAEESAKPKPRRRLYRNRAPVSPTARAAATEVLES